VCGHPARRATGSARQSIVDELGFDGVDTGGLCRPVHDYSPFDRCTSKAREISASLTRRRESQEKIFQPCALGISHDEQKINPRIIILH
jgi:hypothetical protein